jgi:hypothetical protein
MKGVVTILGVLMALPVSAQSDEAKESLVRKLERQRVSLRFDRAPLEEVVDYLRDATGIDFVLDRDLAPRRGAREITIRLTRVRLKSALRLLLGSHDLTAVYRHGALFILPRGKVTKSMTTRVYDVRDLLLKIRDFPGPVMELAGAEPGIVPPDWTDLVPPQQRIDREFLVETIQANTGGSSWDADGKTSVDLVNGLLIVAQSKSVHAEIDGLLNLLRRAR